MSSSAPVTAPTATTPTVGLDIGSTKVLGVLLDHEGNVLREQRRLSPHAGLDALVGPGHASILGNGRGRRGPDRILLRARATRGWPDAYSSDDYAVETGPPHEIS